jgi:L-fuculose-phosphate aldolase
MMSLTREEKRPGTDATARLATQIAYAARMLSLDGHDDFNQGQVSARMPGSDAFFIKDALCGFNEATPSHVTAASTAADAPAGSLAPPELPLHQAIYRVRPDVNGIVHSHAPYTLVFGATDLELRPLSHDGAHFTGRLGLFTQTSNTVLDQATGDAIAQALGDAEGVLLRNHGAVIVGKSVRHAAVFAQVLERACRLQLMAEQSGNRYAWASDADVLRKREFVYADLSVRSYWDYATRLVRSRWPEAAAW